MTVTDIQNILLKYKRPLALFVSIVMPNVRENKNVMIVVIIAVALSCAFSFIPPLLKFVESGLSIVICTVVSSFLGALCFPIESEEQQ